MSCSRAIGFRVEPKAIHWAVVAGSKATPQLVCCKTLAAPKTFSNSESLGWYAKEIVDVLNQHTPNVVWVREAESVVPGPRASLISRSRIEGAIIAVASAQGLPVRLGPLATVTAQVRSKASRSAAKSRPSAKQYLLIETFRGIDWKDASANQREAILVAVAGLS